MLKKHLKQDIEYLFEKLQELSEKNEFKQYRNAVLTLCQTYYSLNKISEYKLFNDDGFNKNSLESLSKEIHKLQKLKFDNHDNIYVFKCLSDSYIKLAELICFLNNEQDRFIKSNLKLV
jgi:hypothetical protein